MPYSQENGSFIDEQLDRRYVHKQRVGGQEVEQTVSAADHSTGATMLETIKCGLITDQTNSSYRLTMVVVSSVLWHCWLGVRKSIRPVNIEWWGVSVVICLERGADCLQYDAIYCWCHCIAKPHHLLPHLNPDWFYLSGTGSPRLS